MTTATKTRKPAKQRTMTYLDAAGLLFIDEARRSVGYMMLETTDQHNGHGRGFRLTKPDGTVYNVLIDGTGSLCDCIGFEHRGMNTKDGKGCKHVAALMELQRLGKLPATTPAMQPALEQPKQVEPASLEFVGMVWVARANGLEFRGEWGQCHAWLRANDTDPLADW